MSKATSESEHLKDMLVGNILAVSWPEVGKTALLYGAIGLFHFIFRRQFLAISMDAKAAEAVSKQFVEVVIAPQVDEGARKVLAAKANVRVLEIALANVKRDANTAWDQGRNLMDFKCIGSGMLMQTADNREMTAGELKVVTQKQPTPAQIEDLLFAWRVAKYVKSNAIVFCANGQTLGVGAGQMNRVESVEIALKKAGAEAQGAVLASDAFFPFKDSVEVAHRHGISSIIQPGGSVRDQESIDAANALGVAMVFTGKRHFKH